MIPPKEKPADHRITIAHLFGTPLTIRRLTWVPITQLITWGVFSNISKRKNPELSSKKRAIRSLLQMIVLLGLEWGHNLAHALAAWLVRKPMDEMIIQFGMPRCQYYHLNDPDVSADEHIIRALGGPLFNFFMLPISLLVRKKTRPETTFRKIANTAVGMNLFLSTVSLLPIPGIDGGPILKWSLVRKGNTIEEADQIIQRVNGPLALVLGGSSAIAFSKKKTLLGIFCSCLGVISLGVFTGLIKEEEITR